jgi:nitrogen fixation protein FixH
MEALGKGATAVVMVESGYLELRFAGKKKEPIAAENLSALLRHPVDGRQELKIEFANEGAGYYRSVSALPAGTWVGDVRGELKGYGHWAQAMRFAVEN